MSGAIAEPSRIRTGWSPVAEPSNLQLARTLSTVYGVSRTVESLELWLGRDEQMRSQALQLHQDVQDLVAGRRESIVTLHGAERIDLTTAVLDRQENEHG
jgi:hypothetical protein